MAVKTDNEHATQFGPWIRDTAARLGYDFSTPRAGGRTQLAADTGMSLASVSRMIAGKTIPDARSVQALATVLELPVTDALIRAGIIAPAGPDGASKPVRKLTDQQALAHLGVTDPADQAAVLAIIGRLNAR